MRVLRWLFAFLFKAQFERLETLERAIALVKTEKCTLHSAKRTVAWMEDPLNRLFGSDALSILETSLQREMDDDRFRAYVHDTLQNLERSNADLQTSLQKLTHRRSPPGFPAMMQAPLNLDDIMVQLEVMSRFQGRRHGDFDGPGRYSWMCANPPGRYVPPNMQSGFGHTEIVDYATLLRRVMEAERSLLSQGELYHRTLSDLQQRFDLLEEEVRTIKSQV